MSFRAFLHGLRVFARQVRCRHEMVRLNVAVRDGRVVPVRVCEKCGYTDLRPLVW